MPFTFVCPNCAAKLKATEALVGKTIKCPRCSRPAPVEQPASASTMPRLEIPPTEEERPELEDVGVEGPTRAARLAGEADELPEVDEEIEEGEEIEEAEIDEAMPADDYHDYDRPRPGRAGPAAFRGRTGRRRCSSTCSASSPASSGRSFCG